MRSYKMLVGLGMVLLLVAGCLTSTPPQSTNSPENFTGLYLRNVTLNGTPWTINIIGYHGIVVKLGCPTDNISCAYTMSTPDGVYRIYPGESGVNITYGLLASSK